MNSINNSITPFSFLLNNFHWDSPFYLISHFPCSYHCNKSIDYAKKLLDWILNYDSDYARSIINFLILPILYLDFHAHFTLKLENGIIKNYYTQQFVDFFNFKNSGYGTLASYNKHIEINELLEKSIHKEKTDSIINDILKELRLIQFDK